MFCAASQFQPRCPHHCPPYFPPSRWPATSLWSGFVSCTFSTGVPSAPKMMGRRCTAGSWASAGWPSGPCAAALWAQDTGSRFCSAGWGLRAARVTGSWPGVNPVNPSAAAGNVCPLMAVRPVSTKWSVAGIAKASSPSASTASLLDA